MTDKTMKNGRKYVDSGFVHDTMHNVNDEHYFLRAHVWPNPQNKLLKGHFRGKHFELKRHLRDRGYPRNLVEKPLSEIKFTRRCSVLKGKNKTQKDIFTFCDTIPAISVKLKTSLTHKMPFNSKSTPTSPNIQRTTYYFEQKKENR